MFTRPFNPDAKFKAAVRAYSRRAKASRRARFRARHPLWSAVTAHAGRSCRYGARVAGRLHPLGELIGARVPSFRTTHAAGREAGHAARDATFEVVELGVSRVHDLDDAADVVLWGRATRPTRRLR